MTNYWYLLTNLKLLQSHCSESMFISKIFIICIWLTIRVNDLVMVWNSSYTAPSGMSNVISFCSDRYLQGIKRKESYFSIHSYIWNPRLLCTWCNQIVLNIFISDHYVPNNSKVQISFLWCPAIVPRMNSCEKSSRDFTWG